MVIYRLNSGIAEFGVYGIEDMFLMTPNFGFFPKNGGIHFYHNVQAFNVDSRSTLKA